MCDKKSINNIRNKSSKKILNRRANPKNILYSKTQEELPKKIKLQPQLQKKISAKKITNKRNYSGLKKISSTTTYGFGPKGSLINITTNMTNNNNIHLNEKNKKLISLKTLKKHILMRPLIIPDSFLFAYKENKNKNNNMKINKNTANNNIDNKNISIKNNIYNNYNNYLSHKNSSSEFNSVFKYNNNNNISNCNTTCNTHTNSNNKSSNSFHKSILKKNTENIICCRINRLKSKKIEDLNKQNINEEKEKEINNKNLYFIGESKLLINSNNNNLNNNENEPKSENYIKYAEEYIDDIFENILIEEKNSKLKINPSYFEFQSDINSKMRAILIDWLIDVHLKFNFKQETLYIAIYIIDTYLSIEKIERSNFQLLGVASLFIACKQNEILFHKLNEYVYITDNAYTVEDIKNMENKILHILNFNILFPSSLTFYEILCNRFNLYKDKKKFNFGQFLLESFSLDENSLKYSPSSIACAVGYIVMKYFKMENYKECYNPKLFNIKPYDKFENYSKNNNYSNFIIKECAKDICFFMNELAKGNLKSTIRKYSLEKYENVSNLLFRNLTNSN